MEKTKNVSEINLRDGFYVVTMAWIFMGIFSSIPYYQSTFFSSFTDAFFESMSGITTTGATVLGNIEALPHGLLFWRSLHSLLVGWVSFFLQLRYYQYWGWEVSSFLGQRSQVPPLVNLLLQ